VFANFLDQLNLHRCICCPSSRAPQSFGRYRKSRSLWGPGCSGRGTRCSSCSPGSCRPSVDTRGYSPGVWGQTFFFGRLNKIYEIQIKATKKSKPPQTINIMGPGLVLEEQVLPSRLAFLHFPSLQMEVQVPFRFLLRQSSSLSSE